MKPFLLLFTLLALNWTGVAQLSAGENSSLKFRSPDGQFTLRMTKPKDPESEWKLDLVEKESGKVVADLGTAFETRLSAIILIWSADSQRLAYASGGDKDMTTDILFRTGSTFKAVPLPEELPSPDIKFTKGAGAEVKNYGDAVRPVRWLKSGNLELSAESTMLSRIDDRTYVGTFLFTIAFDAQHQAKVHTIGKTKTRIDP